MASERPTCETCPYWYSEGDHSIGECRRHAPTYVPATMIASANSSWWETERDESCGDHPDFEEYLLARARKRFKEAAEEAWEANSGKTSS